MGGQPSKQKEIERMTKECMKKGPQLPGKKTVCKKLSEKGYEKLQKMKKENDHPGIVATIRKNSKKSKRFMKF